jgi:hypothetical protein
MPKVQHFDTLAVSSIQTSTLFKNILRIALLCIVSAIGFSQQDPRILSSDSPTVNIKIDGKVVAVWNIDPDTKPWTEPDVFRIERSFRDRKVTYLSGRDSLSFTLAPGGQYDFSVKIKNRGAFPMRITTYAEPVFQQTGVVIFLLLSILITGWLTFSKRKALSTIPLLYLGIIAPLFFWLVTIAGGFIHGQYNNFHDVVSELGAIGTKSEIFMSSGEVLIAALSVFSVIGFFKACKQIGLYTLPVITIPALSISMFWAAVFPMHHELHGTLGPIPLLLNLGALLAIILWKGKKFQSFRVASLISFLFMSMIALRFFPNMRSEWEGLIQRLFYLGWTIWSVALSLAFIRILKTKNAL